MFGLSNRKVAAGSSARVAGTKAPRTNLVAPRFPSRVASVRAVAHGSSAAEPATDGATAVRIKPEKEKGFINQMRMVAMKLHTKDQAPKEGEQPAAPQVWTPTRAGYLKFLAESKVVYDALEAAVQDKAHPEYAPFCNTGLERSRALAEDLKWFKEKFDMEPPSISPDSPGAQYAAKMLELAKTDPQAFICHYYNFYFAHTAGGRMIGNKVASMLLDSETLNFYKWDGEVSEHLDLVRVKINQMSEGWSKEQKDHCLLETQESFKMSGMIMRCITEA